jgi:hypothetical protein
VVDYMAMECLPLMVNDEMVFPYANILEWPKFSLHMRKREIPQIASRLRNISRATQARRRRLDPAPGTLHRASPPAARLDLPTPGRDA